MSADRWRGWIVCLAIAALLLGGIRLHALQFTGTTSHAASSEHASHDKRQSFDGDATCYCVAPPGIFAFAPVSIAFSSVVQMEDVFLPAHLDGWYCNRPPPTL